ncbi:MULTISPECIES: AI-2E family transporter [unclassified Leeuwenhoekiella]|uniref:AI-2E family transporter n=1 Tax=unclassified Leeuwenhoekiella TaxID=2615029 RepID=UPI0025BF1BC0|nr:MULTISPECIES: AI-2E family transporter [unclassified Leeuwenhoekiella]|tara:strand:- start:1256 stop:2299 length:1044 start_codon:yes stop_codon:yes gene_type:complete
MKNVLKVTLFLIAGYFLVSGLVSAQNFFAPLVTGLILALVVLPFVQLLERKKWPKTLSAITGTLVVLLASVAILFLFSLQVKKFVADWPSIQEEMKPKLEQVKAYITANTPLTKKDLSISDKSAAFMPSRERASSILGSFTGFVGNYLLCLIYIYFLLRYRSKFRQFLLRVFSDEKRDQVEPILQESSSVAPQYLIGKLMLMGILAILYSIGLGISGVDNYILVSLLAATFTLIPYIGNLIGICLAVALGYLTSGDIMTLVGILITFSVAQFIENYVLEPFIVGDRVDLHPFVVILVVVMGNMIWGVIGMVLAIPVTAILAVVLLNIPKLKPYGVLISKQEFKPSKG